MAREPKRLGAAATAVVTLLIAALIAATGLVIWLCADMVNRAPAATEPGLSIVLPTDPAEPAEVPEEPTVPPTTEPPVPEHVVATATISSQGDLLMHSPVFNSCKQSDGSYSFDSVFKYLKDTVSGYDYALANLETTLSGAEKHVPNQSFSCPPELAADAAEAGFDMLLTVNNHCGDTLSDGVDKTLEVARAAGLATLGTQYEGEKRYSVVDINGIQVGMMAYSWAFSFDGTKVSMNGLSGVPAKGRINFFRNSDLPTFYAEAEQLLAEMKADGAEVTMMQIHWGVEYVMEENDTQNKIAQKLCDMGFDVIVGGHPHVVQPMELLTSTEDPEHKTVCIYSLGNAVSNQRTGVSDRFPTGYTEDGVLFAVTFEKYSDGKVYLAGADVIPTWVNMHSNQGSREYNILPLDKTKEDQWKEAFQLTDGNLNSCLKSYDRTMGIVGEGLEACKTWLEAEKIAREQYYYDLAFFPERFADEEAQTPPETTESPTETAAAAA